MKIDRLVNRLNCFAFIGILVIAYSSYLAMFYAGQPPLDQYSFRQAQTALTAYWFVQDGLRLAYETPVAGVPWSIPFEFPLYQFVVATISAALGVSLDAAGRVVSFIFLIACLVPARSITIKLRLDLSVFYVFAALLFSSPIYVYWGRTFMIETTALFLSMLAIKYFVDALVDGFDRETVALFPIFVSLSILQKSTTALPILAILSLIYLLFELRKWSISRALVLPRLARVILICFVLPLAVGILWVIFTDNVKLENPLGQMLSSSALSKWNWGTFEQRISKTLYVDVLWGRIISANLGSFLGLFFILFLFVDRDSGRLKRIAVVSLAMGLAPLFIFTNLHIVHTYYQSANVIFLIYALAISLGEVALPKIGFCATLSALVLILCSNYTMLFSTYMPFIKRSFSKADRDFALGGVLRREIPTGGQFVAFGNDWSSTFSYMAQRKSFTVPVWFKDYSKVVSNPEDFVEEGKLGALVSCSIQSPSVKEFLEFASKKSWKVGEMHGCLVATPKKAFSVDKATRIQCQGSLDHAAFERRDGASVISIAGWTTMGGTHADFPSSIYVVISNGDGNDRYVEALRVPRPDVSKHLGVAEDEDGGFTSLLPVNIPPVEYYINIAQAGNDKNEICQYNKKLLIKD